MPKELRCGDIMPDCTTVLEGKDDKEAMAKARLGFLARQERSEELRLGDTYRHQQADHKEHFRAAHHDGPSQRRE